MKYSILKASFILLLLLGGKGLLAQDTQPESYKYFILSKNVKQLAPILLTANALIKTDGKRFGELQILFCGKTIEAINNHAEFLAQLEKAKSKDIKILVCGLSLDQFDIDHETLPDHLQVVENGILHALQLKKNGFITLSI